MELQPSFLPSFSFLFSRIDGAIYSILSSPLKKYRMNSISFQRITEGREKGGEELSHRAVRGGYSIGVLISARSLIVALSCKEIVIYRKKWWFEHSLILSANTYIYIYTLYKRELRFRKELLLLLWSDDGKWIPSLLPSHCLLIANEEKCNEVDWSNQRNCLVRFTINILIESSTFRLIAPRSDIIAK